MPTMKYRMLRWGLLLTAVGAYIALMGWREVADDLDWQENNDPYARGFAAGQVTRARREAQDAVGRAEALRRELYEEEEDGQAPV